MKLKVAMMFQEHMILQQGKNIPIWGNSVNNDEVTVSLNGISKTAHVHNGDWFVEFEPMEATFKTSLIISSKKTDEVININDVAIGEVILAGGQSNMEFLMKYDYNFQEVKTYESDHYLRYFCYPQTAYVGFLEKEPLGDVGYWRSFEEVEDRGMFSAVGAYAGIILRKELGVPVGIISCNWGGTPATAWINIDDIIANPKLKPVLDWQDNAVKNTKWESYIKSAFERLPEQSPEQIAFMDKFLMGEDMSEFLKDGPPPMNPEIYNSYLPGPLSCIRPGGLYESMLSKLAPYPISSIIWWQGEDDDARDWVDFYDESMNTLIKSWRKLWKEELPFFQIELAPFRGKGVTGAKLYDVIRHKQYKATSTLNNAYDICILDAGEEYNIHTRHKKIVGDRVGKMLLEHVYGKDVNADSPIIKDVKKIDDQINISFDYTYGEIYITDELKKYLIIKDNDNIIDYDASVEKDILVLKGDFKNKVTIEYCESNYVQASIFNKQHNPVFGFKVEV